MNLALMRLIDQQLVETAFHGVGQMTWHLQNKGSAVKRKRIRRQTRQRPIRQKPDTGRSAKGHQTYPHLPGGQRVEGSNQV